MLVEGLKKERTRLLGLVNEPSMINKQMDLAILIDRIEQTIKRLEKQK
jgi:hypothetical protein